MARGSGPGAAGRGTGRAGPHIWAGDELLQDDRLPDALLLAAEGLRDILLPAAAP